MIEKTILVKATIAVASVAVVAGAVAAVNHRSKTKDTYRSILIYEMEGTAEIDREGTGKFNGAENLYLESGDQLTVESESFTRLRLDEDKYVMVEENSALSIEAAGTSENSRTKINLTRGAIINEIQNPLSADSTYEVGTPNSIMAVRGTIFRVEVYYDENGEIYTKVTVFEGQVSSRLIYPDGTMTEEILTSGGKEVIIHSNENLTEYLGDARDIKYDELSLNSLYAIQNMMDKGSVFERITAEELAELIRRMEGEDNPQIEKEDQAPKETENIKETESTTEAESMEETEESRKERETQRESQPEQGTESSGVPETTQGEESSAVEETIPLPTETQAANSSNTAQRSEYRYSRSSGSSGGSSSGGSSSSGVSRPTESTTEASAEAPTEATTEAPTEAAEYTVSFIYNGDVFATQQVKAGEQATEPWLKPAASGSWKFTFSTQITEDTAIEWGN